MQPRESSAPKYVTPLYPPREFRECAGVPYAQEFSREKIPPSSCT